MCDDVTLNTNNFCFFFFKQKTAYEIAQCLVGSEMCIRDRTTRVSNFQAKHVGGVGGRAKLFCSMSYVLS